MNLKKYHVYAFLFILVCGTLLHFTYEWSGGNRLVGYFSAVNESPWEHLKLIFWPAIVFSLFEYRIYGNQRLDFFAVKMTAIILSLVFVLTFFYTYSGVLGFNLLFLDIADFVIADFLCCYTSFAIQNNTESGSAADSAKGIAVLALIGLCFILWTNNPPDLGVFWG